MGGLPLAELLVFPFFLLVARVGMAVMVFPAFSDISVSTRIRLLIVFGISLVLFPLLGPQLPALPATTGNLVLLLLGELVVGLMLGLGARMMMVAMSLAGELIAFLAGFQSATLFDPQSGTNTPAPTLFLTLCATLMILALNLHYQLIEAIMQSYIAFPPGKLPDVGDVSAAAVDMFAVFTALGVQLAAPVIVAGLLSNVLFGVMNRLIPQLQIFFVSVPVSITLSLLVLGAGLGTMMQLWSHATESRLTMFQADED
jgi:flagellar biosynthetic protein FliR